MNVRVQPDPAHPAGHALIFVDGAAMAREAPGFRLQRPDWEDDQLGSDGWQSSDMLLQPDLAEARGSDLVLHVGWRICRHLEAGVYEISVPAAGLGPTGVSWPDIAPMHAGYGAMIPLTPAPVVALVGASGLTTSADTAVIDRPAAPATTAPELPAVPPPQVTARPPPSRIQYVLPVKPLPPSHAARFMAILAVCLVAILLLAGGGYYYWWQRTGLEPAAAEPDHEPVHGPVAAAPAPIPPPPPSPVPLSALSVPDVLVRAPNTAAITAEGIRRLESGHPDDGMLLLETAADRGDPAAAASLARMYDPVLFQAGGPIPHPDARQAARYYRDAASGGTDVAAPRSALQRHLQARVQAGDLTAGLCLKDFWP